MTAIGIIAAALGILSLVGWPTVAFTHYYFRKKYRLTQALFLTIAPSMGAILVLLFVSESLMEFRYSHPWLAAFFGVLGIFWFALPNLFLAVWAVQAFRRRR